LGGVVEERANAFCFTFFPGCVQLFRTGQQRVSQSLAGGLGTRRIGFHESFRCFRRTQLGERGSGSAKNNRIGIP